MKYLTIGLVLILPFTCIAQNKNVINKKPIDQRQLFIASYSYLSFQNKQDVETFEGNQKFLTAKNTPGYQIGLSYEYTNRYNITFTPSINYGIQRTNLIWLFSFDNFDKNVDFGGYTSTYMYRQKIRFLTTSFSIGYDYLLSEKLKTKLQLKAGLGTIHRFDYNTEIRAHVLSYYDNLGEEKISQYAYTDPEAGHNGSWIDPYPFYTLYLGLAKGTLSNFIREYRIGLGFTHGLKIRSGENPLNFSRGFYYNSSGERTGIELYRNKFRSISFTASIGL